MICFMAKLNLIAGLLLYFKNNDAAGLGMAFTVTSVAVLGLIVLFLMYRFLAILALSISAKRAMKASGVSKEEARGISEQSGAVYAAIAMAIYEATELHDDEQAILTIKNTARRYSPWSSKIYTLRELPNKQSK